MNRKYPALTAFCAFSLSLSLFGCSSSQTDKPSLMEEAVSLSSKLCEAVDQTIEELKTKEAEKKKLEEEAKKKREEEEQKKQEEENKNQIKLEKTPLKTAVEIGQLDQTPIALARGWLCVKDGKVGFIDVQGNWKIEPEYDTALLLLEPGDVLNQKLSTATGITISNEDDPEHGWRIKDDVIEPCIAVGVGGIPADPYSLVNGTLARISSVEGPAYPGTSSYDDNLPDQAATVYSWISNHNWDESNYYIWIPESDELAGPYQSDESPAFGIRKAADPVGIYNSSNNNYPVNGPFYVKQPDGTYAVYSADGSKREYGYSFAQPCGINGMTVIKDGTLQVLDGALNVVYSGSGENSSQPVSNVIMVERNGIWYCEPAGL